MSHVPSQTQSRALFRVLRVVFITAAAVLGLTVAGAMLFVLEVLSRETPAAVPSTTHPSIARRECLECHAPIAAPWRQSYYYRSLTGPYWKDVQDLGYRKVFQQARKACVNCHAPANVSDLSDPRAYFAPADGTLGVECTPNLLREPRGLIPAARADEAELGVDCTSCHVGRQGIVGPGRHPASAHEASADPRFQDPVLASERICGTCHSSTVRAWRRTKFALEGVTCLDCHMPVVMASSAAGAGAPAPESQVPRRQRRVPAGEGRTRDAGNRLGPQGAIQAHQRSGGPPPPFRRELALGEGQGSG